MFEFDPATATDAEIRRSGIGGTDASAIARVNEHKTPHDVWRSKFLGHEDPETRFTRWGKKLEAPVRSEYEEINRGKVITVPSPPRYRNKAHAWWIGAPDFLCYEQERALAMITQPDGSIADLLDARTSALHTTGARPDWIGEVKTHGFHGGRQYGEEETDDVPMAYVVQAVWYMGLLRVDRVDFAVLIDTSDYRSYRLYRDEELLSTLLEAGQDFWHRNVRTGLEPAPDGSDARSRWIRERLGRDNGLEVIATPEQEAEARALARLKAELKALEVKAETIAQVLQEAMGEAAKLLAPDGTVLATWKTNGRGNCRYKEALYDLAAQVGRTDREIDQLIDNHRGAPARPYVLKIKG